MLQDTAKGGYYIKNNMSILYKKKRQMFQNSNIIPGYKVARNLKYGDDQSFRPNMLTTEYQKGKETYDNEEVTSDNRNFYEKRVDDNITWGNSPSPIIESMKRINSVAGHTASFLNMVGTEGTKLAGDLSKVVTGNTKTTSKRKDLNSAVAKNTKDTRINAGKNIATEVALAYAGESLFKYAGKAIKGLLGNKARVPKSNTTIDWGKWNKEIPRNKALMAEYSQIEKVAKGNGTWMKNPDGTVFKGPVEEFIQTKSKNFKKAFPKHEVSYHGTYDDPLVNIEARKNSRAAYGDGLYLGSERTANKYAKVGNPDYDSQVYKLALNSDDIVYTKDFYNKDTEQLIQSQMQAWNKGKLPTREEAFASYKKLSNMDEIPEYMIENLDKSLPHTGNVPPMLKSNPKTVNISSRDWYVTKDNVKSLQGNNGQFDVKNSNIYKVMIPALLGINTSAKKNKK